MCFSIRNFWWWQKNLKYMINFLCQIEISLLNMLKLMKITGFSRFCSKFLKFQVILPKLSNSRFFEVKWQPCLDIYKLFLWLNFKLTVLCSKLITVKIYASKNYFINYFIKTHILFQFYVDWNNVKGHRESTLILQVDLIL